MFLFSVGLGSVKLHFLFLFFLLHGKREGLSVFFPLPFFFFDCGFSYGACFSFSFFFFFIRVPSTVVVVSYLKDLGLLPSTHFPLFFHFLLARMTFTYGNWWDGVFFSFFLPLRL